MCLVLDHLGIAEGMARRAWVRSSPALRRRIDAEDLVSEATIGLIRAAESWDEQRPFANFASVCIRNAIVEAFKREKCQRQRGSPGAGLAVIGLDTLHSDPPARPQPGQTDQWWTETLERLEPHERTLLIEHFRHGRTMESLSRETDIPSSTLRLRRNAALEKLRNVATASN